MKYRDLKLSFTMSDIRFNILSISFEKMEKPYPKHSHGRQSYELHYIKQGYGTLIANDKEYDLSPGIFYVTGPEVFHEQIPDEKDPMVEYGMYLQVDIQSKITPDNPMYSFINRDFFMGDAVSGIALIMEQIQDELRNRALGYRLLLSSLSQSLLLLITRMYEVSGKDVSRPLAANPEDMTFLTIEEAFLYDYRTLTLSELANRLGLGTRQTERLLMKHYNMTFSRKKAEARMFTASLLLTETKKSISEISEELGFSSYEHFANAFKKYYSVTPAVYRKVKQH